MRRLPEEKEEMKLILLRRSQSMGALMCRTNGMEAIGIGRRGALGAMVVDNGIGIIDLLGEILQNGHGINCLRFYHRSSKGGTYS